MIRFSYAMIFYIFADIEPPVVLIAFSAMTIWFNLLLQLRVYKPIGVLLIVITDMTKGVGWFLVLMAGLVLGFFYVPFFIFRDMASSSNTDDNDFTNFPVLLTDMIKFLEIDFSSLQDFESLASIRITRVALTIVMTVLLLNLLIALHN